MQNPPLPPPPGTIDEPEPPPPPARSSAAPVVLAVAAVVAVALGAFGLVRWAGGGATCEGSFESARFGYCARTPAGWIAAPADGDDTALDRFLLQDGAATITVTAVPLTRGQDLARFEQFVRGWDEDTGARTTESSTLEVDGVDALAFDVILDGPDGVVRSTEVLFVRDEVAWRVTLADQEVGFEASSRRLDELLESWRFT
jgi:hypothetical protein